MEENITISLPNGEKRPVPKGTKLLDIADKDAVAAQIDGSMVDLSRPLERDAAVSFISGHSRKGLDILRHSAAHVMAQAVKELFPSVKLTFGPSTEGGFYYDFYYEKT
jgi:threonyl-tRNA synthetase